MSSLEHPGNSNCVQTIDLCAFCAHYGLVIEPQPNAPVTAPQAQPLLTVKDVSVALRVSRSTIRRAIAAGAFPVVRLGRSVRVTPDALAAYIAARTSTTANRKDTA